MSPFCILLELRMMDVVVRSGAIRCAKLQSTVNTNKSTFTGRMPFLSPNERQSTEGKEIQLRTKMEKPSTKMHSQYYTVLYCTVRVLSSV